MGFDEEIQAPFVKLEAPTNDITGSRESRDDEKARSSANFTKVVQTNKVIENHQPIVKTEYGNCRLNAGRPRVNEVTLDAAAVNSSSNNVEKSREPIVKLEALP